MVKRKAIIITVSIFLFVAIVLAIVLPSLYENGLLGTAHPLRTPSEGQIRVACVGDSITYGHSVAHWTKNNYPTKLQSLLGDGYCVNNYGYSGRCVLSTSDNPYRKEKLYEKSLSFNPDIVIIMLGSNDTKPHNWTDADSFKAEYKTLIESYLALPSSPEIYLLSPLPAFKNAYKINEQIISGDLRHIAKDVADELGLGYIDMYSVFENRADLFGDGVHPTKKGAELFANTIYEQIFCK